MNAQNIYLNSDLDKKIYMKISKNIKNAENSNLVCLLLKNLYDLKQSVNLWNKKIIFTVQFFKFEFIIAESSIFIDKRKIIIVFYIDDFFIFIKNESDVEQIKKLIKNKHIMKNMREVSKILNIHVTRSINNEFVWIDQNHYIQQILTEFDMKNAKSAFTLMSSSIKLDDKISQILSWQDHELYHKIMRKLMFALIMIWIDIITVINRLS